MWISGSEQDSLLTLYVNGANARVKNFTGRVFGSEEYTEIIDGNAQISIFTKNTPITDITSIEYNTGTIAIPDWVAIETEYTFKNYMIQLEKPTTRGLANYRVIYTAGYDPIPWDITLATLRVAKMMMETSDVATSESVGGDSITYRVEQSNDLQSIFAQYKHVL